MSLFWTESRLTFLFVKLKTHFALAVVFLFNFISGLDLYAQSTCTSISSGNWNQRSVWSCGKVPTNLDDAIISSGTTVTLVNSQSVNNLTIDQFGTLDDNNAPSLVVSGNLIVNGAISGTPVITLNGASKFIGGKGNLSNTSTITVTGNKTIQATAELSFAGNIAISTATTVTNNGVITISGVMNGTTSSSIWVNASNSTLNVGANTLLTTGGLNASAVGNTVNYFHTLTDFVITPPVGGIYHHLIISGGNTKTLPDGTIIVNGNLTLNSTLNGNGGLKILRVRGNWTNNSSTGFTEGAGTVIFDGSSDQYITKSTSEDFHNLTIEKNSSVLYLNADIVVGTTLNLVTPSTLTLTSGSINTGSYSVTIGKGSGAPGDNFVNEVYSGRIIHGSGKIIGRLTRYIYNVSYPASIDSPSGAVLFPIGSLSNSRFATVSFTNVTSGTLTGEFKSAYPGNNGLPLPPENGVTISNTFREGYWALTSGGGLNSTNYALSLTADGFGTGQVLINDNTRILTRANSAVSWSLNGVHQVRNGNTIRRSSMTTLSAEYSLGSDNPCAAPVTSVISGNSSVCVGASGAIYSVSNTGNAFAWKVVGGTIAAGQNTNSITVNWGNVGMSGSVSVIESNTCTSGAEVILPVVISPTAPSSITGRLSVPANGVSPITYSITPVAGYTYNWTVTGGTPASGTGNSINVIWGSVGTGTVCVTATNVCGTSTPPTCVSINKYTVIRSVQSGNWTSSTTWDCGGCIPQSGDNVMIMNTHTVTIVVSGGATIRNLIINPGGVLNTGTNSNRTLTVTGDLTIDGTLGGAFADVILNASFPNPILDGNGNITNSRPLQINANRTITSSSSITKQSGNVILGSGVEITNNGNVSIGANLEGTNNTSIWVNKAASFLNVGGTLLSNGILVASESGNTVAYSGGIAQSIKTPQNSQYASILFSGAGIKNAPIGTINVSGNFTNNGTGVSGAFVGFNPNGGTINFNGNSVITGTATTSFNSIVIDGVLTSPPLVNVSGNFTNNGTFSSNNGTVNFNGTATSTINGSAARTNFYNLTVANLAGVKNEQSVDLTGVLSVNGNAYIDVDGQLNNREFVLKSSGDNPVVDASIAPLTNATAVQGKVVVERFISNEGRLYRYISAPVQGVNVSDWMDDFPVTGLFPDRTTSWTGPLCNNLSLAANSASLFYYNEALPGDINQGYVAYPGAISAATSPLIAGRGYAAFVRVCPSAGLTVDLRGEIYQGAVNLPVTYTALSGVNNDGWNLIGNPYASAIDWDVTGANGWTKNNVSNIVAVPDNATGVMRYWDGTTGELTGGIIASGQAFWVKATGASPTLTIREGVKVTTNTHQFYKETEDQPEVLSVMRISLTNTQGVTDNAYVKIRDRVSYELDSWDATKLENGGPGLPESELFELSTLTPTGLSLAYNSIPAAYDGMAIALKMKDLSDGAYSLNLKGEGEFSDYQIELIDRYSGVSKILKWGDLFEFSIQEDELKTHNEDRFILVLRKELKSVATTSFTNLSVFPNPVRETLTINFGNDTGEKLVTIYDSVGGLLDQIAFKSNEEYGQIDFNSKPTGVYLIRVSNAGYSSWAKVIKN